MSFLQAYWLILLWLTLLLAARAWLARSAQHDAPRIALAREICLFLAAYLVYFCVRGLAKDRVELAHLHAQTLLGFERQRGIAWEAGVQRATLRADLLVDLANWIYIWLFWPLLAVVLVWLFQRHRPQYTLYRNAILISGALGLTLFLTYPVAPPRFLDGEGFIDTVGNRSVSYQLLLPHALANLYAAMPSLHAGWVLIAGLSVALNADRRSWRVVGLLLPVAMFLSIVATANHYVVDGLVGWLVAGLALGAARVIAQPSAPMTWLRMRLRLKTEQEHISSSALSG
jgi:hypothetical protein